MLPLVYAPHPIFKQKAAPVETVDDAVQDLVSEMFETLYHEDGIGLAAPMVGISKRIAIVDIRSGGMETPLTFINPEIIHCSEETQTHEEASLSFPFISAPVIRPREIRLRYLDYHGKPAELEAKGFLATVIQHEIDYLDGITYLDRLSRMKRDMLLKKMEKQMKANPPHVHGPGCRH